MAVNPNSKLTDNSTYTPPASSFGVKYGIPLALQLGLTGLSAGQSMAARNRIRGMQLPTLPQVTRNPLLAGRIGQAQREAAMGTDALRREREASTARATEQARQVASQLGGAQFAAMMQNQAVANDQSRRQGLLQDEALRMQRQGQLDQLIGMDMQQDARADQFALQDFNNRFQFANQMRLMEEANLRQANSNLAATAGALAADMPSYADAFMKARQLRRGAFNQQEADRTFAILNPPKPTQLGFPTLPTGANMGGLAPINYQPNLRPIPNPNR